MTREATGIAFLYGPTAQLHRLIKGFHPNLNWAGAGAGEMWLDGVCLPSFGTQREGTGMCCFSVHCVPAGPVRSHGLLHPSLLRFCCSQMSISNCASSPGQKGKDEKFSAKRNGKAVFNILLYLQRTKLIQTVPFSVTSQCLPECNASPQVQSVHLR